MEKAIIVVNPGSTSTKVALFDLNNKCIADSAVSHPSDQLAEFENVADQFLQLLE